MRYFQKWAADEDGWDPDTGAAGIMLFARAIQVWSVMQDQDTSLAEAARVFHVTSEQVREAVQAHPWMFIGRNEANEEIIEHEGE